MEQVQQKKRKESHPLAVETAGEIQAGLVRVDTEKAVVKVSKAEEISLAKLTCDDVLTSRNGVDTSTLGGLVLQAKMCIGKRKLRVAPIVVKNEKTRMQHSARSLKIGDRALQFATENSSLRVGAATLAVICERASRMQVATSPETKISA